MAEEESSSILGYKYPDILQVIAQQLTQFGIIEPVLSQASPTAHFSSLLSISRDASSEGKESTRNKGLDPAP